jgi:hypothetical protein
MASADNLLAAVDNETTKLSLATVDNSKQLQSSVSSVKAELQTSVFKGLGEISGSLLEYQNDLTYSLAGGMRQVFAGISRSNDKLVLGIWSGFRDTTISSGQLVADLWSVGINYLAGMSDSSVLAWKNFLGIKDNMNTDLSASGTDPNTLKDQIKQELYNELKNEMSASSSLPASSGKPAGLVVFPSSGSTTLDSAQTAKIKQSFSDNVIINYDSKNQSGIIKPVFRDSVGSSYLFVLTPLGR